MTVRQRKYYRGVLLVTIIKWLNIPGIDKDDMDAYLSKKYLGYDDDKIIKSPEDIPEDDFLEYCHTIQRDFAELGLVIPDANQTDFL